MGFFDGFFVTLRQFGHVVTHQYPKVKRPKPPRFHGRHVLNRYEDGMEKCIGCELCAGVCPARCIYVRGADNPPEQPVSPGERYGFVYEINYLRCIHCDLCVEACPTEAITESKLFEFSFFNRQDAIYTKNELVVGDDGQPKHMPWEDWRDGDDADTSAWVRATSPSGAAEYEGKVQWSGELGYGVRQPEQGQTAADTPAEEREHMTLLLAATKVDTLVFVLASVIVLSGAIGVVIARNPVHSALMLVMTLFGIAVLFVAQDAQFLAAVQVIVYAGAIVVLFLFVIMLLGVDREENLGLEELRAQRPVGFLLGVIALAEILLLGRGADWVSGASSVAGRSQTDATNVETLARSIFTRYLLAFEVTSVLLVIAVVGAVVLARKLNPATPCPEDGQ